jgi:hypothetical protein
MAFCISSYSFAKSNVLRREMDGYEGEVFRYPTEDLFIGERSILGLHAGSRSYEHSL